MASKKHTAAIIVISVPVLALVAFIVVRFLVHKDPTPPQPSLAINTIPTVVDASVCGVQQSDISISWDNLGTSVGRVAVVQILDSNSNPTSYSRYAELIGEEPTGSKVLNYTFFSVALTSSSTAYKVHVSLCTEDDYNVFPDNCTSTLSTVSSGLTVNRDTTYSKTEVPENFTTKIHAYEHCGRSRSIVISLDDGPATELDATRKILDLMSAQYPEVKLSFFVSPISYGEYSMEERCELVRDMILDGHDVQSHSWTHKNFTKSYDNDYPGMLDELDHVRSWIQCCTGSNYNVTIFRPPYGELSVPLGRLATQVGYSLAFWNSDLYDYEYFNQFDPIGNATKLQQMLDALNQSLPSADSFDDVLLLGHDRNIYQSSGITEVITFLKARLPNHKFVSADECWKSCLEYSNGTGFCNDPYIYPATDRFAEYLATL